MYVILCVCHGPTGLLVAYCSRFDVWVNSRKKIYFVSCCIGTSHLNHYCLESCHNFILPHVNVNYSQEQYRKITGLLSIGLMVLLTLQELTYSMSSFLLTTRCCQSSLFHIKQLTDNSSSDWIAMWCKLWVYIVSFLLCFCFPSLLFPEAYLLGMILTFAVMLLSGMGQPALLYLVPFTLITSAVVAGCRGEMKQFWAGTTYEVRGWEREWFLYRFDKVVVLSGCGWYFLCGFKQVSVYFRRASLLLYLWHKLFTTSSWNQSQHSSFPKIEVHSKAYCQDLCSLLVTWRIL